MNVADMMTGGSNDENAQEIARLTQENQIRAQEEARMLEQQQLEEQQRVADEQRHIEEEQRIAQEQGQQQDKPFEGLMKAIGLDDQNNTMGNTIGMASTLATIGLFTYAVGTIGEGIANLGGVPAVNDLNFNQDISPNTLDALNALSGPQAPGLGMT